MVAVDAVIYSKTGCQESEVMREYLNAHGIDCRLRPVDGDRGARQEWEDLDGQVTPLLVLDHRGIVRGLDTARIDQLIGFIGC